MKRRTPRIDRMLARGAAALIVAVPLSACAATSGAEMAAARPIVTQPLGAYLAARHAQQIRDYAAAADFYMKALAADPDDFDLMTRTLLLETSEGRIASSLPLATRVAAVDSTAAIANFVLTVAKVKDGDFAAADALAAALPSDGVHRFATTFLRAWVKAGEGDIDAALAALSELGETRGLAALKDFHSALIDDLAGRDDAAEAAYKAVVAASPRPNWRSIEALGNFYERHGRASEAKELYQHFLDETHDGDFATAALARVERGEVPKRRVPDAVHGAAEAFFDLATVLNQSETLDLALIYDRFALFLEPSLPMAQLLLADILEAQRRPAAALAALEAIDRASPYGWTARLRAAGNLEALQRTDEAIAALRAMAAERPQQAQPLIALGDLLRSKNRYDQAVEAYDEALHRLGPDSSQWSFFYSRGVALERAGDWPRAEADLKRALELQPDQPYVLNYLGYSWVDKGTHLDEALKMIEHAVELRPNDGYIVDSLGWAYDRLGDYAKATTQLERAVELKAEDPTINDHLGDVYWRTGRYDEARAQWRRALQFGPEASEVASIEAKLARGLEAAPEQRSSRGG